VVTREETTLLLSFLGISLGLRPMYLSVFAFSCVSSRLFVLFIYNLVVPWCVRTALLYYNCVTFSFYFCNAVFFYICKSICKFKELKPDIKI